MSVGVYIRVSTRYQNPASQKSEVEQWLRSNGRRPEAICWYEGRETGRTLERPAFMQLQAGIFNGWIKTVVVWKLDRLARKIKDGVTTIADWCDKGVRVVATTQQIDLSGPTGHVVASLLFSIAEIELQHAKECQAAGIILAKQKGVYTGRKKGMTKAKLDRAVALQARGFTALEIANALSVSKRTVFRYLKP